MQKLEDAIKEFQSKMEKNTQTLRDGKTSLSGSFRENSPDVVEQSIPHNRFLPIHVAPPSVSSHVPILSRNIKPNSSTMSSAYGTTRPYLDNSMRSGVNHPAFYEQNSYDRNFRTSGTAPYVGNSVAVGPSREHSLSLSGVVAKSPNSLLNTSHKSDYFGSAYKQKFPSSLGFDTSPIKKLQSSMNEQQLSSDGKLQPSSNELSKAPVQRYGLDSDEEEITAEEKKKVEQRMKAIGKMQMQNTPTLPTMSAETLYLEKAAGVANSTESPHAQTEGQVHSISPVFKDRRKEMEEPPEEKVSTEIDYASGASSSTVAKEGGSGSTREISEGADSTEHSSSSIGRGTGSGESVKQRGAETLESMTSTHVENAIVQEAKASDCLEHI